MRSMTGMYGVTAALLLAALPGCEDRLEPTGRQALATLSGVVSWSGDGEPARPHVGMVWTAMGESDLEPRLATDAKPLSGGFPAAFDLSVFDAPSDMLAEAEFGDGSLLGYAIGVVFAFDDVDGDGTFQVDADGIAPPDRMLGVSTRDFLLYLDGSLTEAAARQMFENPEAVHAGMLRVRMEPCSWTLTIVDASEPLEIHAFDPDGAIDPGEEDECPPAGTTCDRASDPSACLACIEASGAACELDACGQEKAAFDACTRDAEGGEEDCVSEAMSFYGCIEYCTDWEGCVAGL